MTTAPVRWALALLLLCALPACSDGTDDGAQNAAEDSTAFNDSTARAFFNAHQCNACHEVDEQRIGPAFRDVAIRYEDASPNHIDWLAQKILHGGAGSWGFVPMVSSPDVSQEDARAISRWIFELDEKPAR